MCGSLRCLDGSSGFRAGLGHQRRGLLLGGRIGCVRLIGLFHFGSDALPPFFRAGPTDRTRRNRIMTTRIRN